RTNRIAELIQSIIADLLIKSVNDPRLKNISITHVKLPPDFSVATIYFSTPDLSAATIKDAETAFQKASGFFRVNLSKMTELRHTPKLIFRFDKTGAEAERISRLLDDCK
ncbi:MAG: hypothetical protein ACD_29C00031G0007, partial [uncultured bacterium]